MATIFDLDKRVATGVPLAEDELEMWIAESDASRHKTFLGGSDAATKEAAKEAVKRISTNFVDVYLNNSNVAEVPLRRKTKFCLVLNNFALAKPLRNSVFHAIKNLSGIFEDSMKKEGTMPFDSELGRMSEHVLVLLMRVMQYKLKASAVHEFAENNTQFAVQLLLAILLKEPPYEFELRCNCIAGLLGFTQPQAFFSAEQNVEVHECEGFTAKIDFILNLMLRLQALQVVGDVLAEQLLASPVVPAIVHVAVCNAMRCTMNIFQFSSSNSTQWRQHVLLSTTFVDNAVVLYLQSQTNALQSLLSAVLAPGASAAVPNDLLQGVALGLKFIAFAAFRMDLHGRSLRTVCSFMHDLLNLPLRNVVYNPALSALTLNLYTALFHALCNMDALAGDDGIAGDDDMIGGVSALIPELTSDELRKTISAFLTREVVPCGAAFADAWHAKFLSSTAESGALVAQDSATYAEIDALFLAAKRAGATAAAPAAPAAAPAAAAAAEPPKRLLGDMPSLQKPARGAGGAAEKKVAPSEIRAPVEAKVSTKKAPSATGAGDSVSTAAAAAAGANRFACALSGNIMKNPVISPYGHTYERETIELWLRQQGSVCPITGKPLTPEMLSVNKALQQEIMAMVIQESMANFNQEDAADLYDF